jgi:hypothetical protein
VSKENTLLATLSSDLSSFGDNLLSKDKDFLSSLGSWIILLGPIFYITWSVFFETWLDPGIYSVTITLVSIGYGISIFTDSE